MYEKNVLVYRVAPTIATSSNSNLETDLEVVETLAREADNLQNEFMEEFETEYIIASASDANYETAVINRLDTISVSMIFSTCFLFLLLLRHRS